jgi:hypothetical protein
VDRLRRLTKPAEPPQPRLEAVSKTSQSSPRCGTRFNALIRREGPTSQSWKDCKRGPEPGNIKMVSRQARFKISSITQSGFVIGMDPDLVYRGRTGTDLARVLKEQWPTTPVLLNSGHQAGRRTFRPTSDLLRTRVSPPQETCYASEPSRMTLCYGNHSC